MSLADVIMPSVDLIAQMPSTEFTNEHGEKFYVHTNGVVVFISGDEVDMMVDEQWKIANKYLPLFNPHFSIWDEVELNKLGKALQELTKE